MCCASLSTTIINIPRATVTPLDHGTRVLFSSSAVLFRGVPSVSCVVLRGCMSGVTGPWGRAAQVHGKNEALEPSVDASCGMPQDLVPFSAHTPCFRPPLGDAGAPRSPASIVRKDEPGTCSEWHACVMSTTSHAHARALPPRERGAPSFCVAP